MIVTSLSRVTNLDKSRRRKLKLAQENLTKITATRAQLKAYSERHRRFVIVPLTFLPSFFVELSILLNF